MKNEKYDSKNGKRKEKQKKLNTKRKPNSNRHEDALLAASHHHFPTSDDIQQQRKPDKLRVNSGQDSGHLWVQFHKQLGSMRRKDSRTDQEADSEYAQKIESRHFHGRRVALQRSFEERRRCQKAKEDQVVMLSGSADLCCAQPHSTTRKHRQ